MKAEQECTLADGIHLSTCFVWYKFDILNHDGLGCRSANLCIFCYYRKHEIVRNVIKPEAPTKFGDSILSEQPELFSL